MSYDAEPADLHPTDQLAPLIGGELDLLELREVIRHVRRCPVCQADMVEIAAGLGALRAVDREGLDDIAEPPPLAVHPLEVTPSPVPRSVRSTRSRVVGTAVAAVAAVIVLVSAGVLVRSQLDGEPTPGTNVATAELLPVGPVDATGRVTMTDEAGDQVMSVETSQLPPAPDGKFYEVWLLQPDTGQMLAVGVLLDGGAATFALPADLVANYQAVDVSLQPDNGLVVHSGESVLRATYA